MFSTKTYAGVVQKRYTHLLRAGLLIAVLVTSSADGQPNDATDSEPDRIEVLLQKMTLDEKLGQLTQQSDSGIECAKNEEYIQVLLGSIRQGQLGSLLNSHGAEHTNRMQRAAVEETRLGIPLILANDVIHGYRTVFPIPLAEAASWSPEVVASAARVAAAEAAAAGTHWTFAPMVDICRDPRWGRIAEGSGEDPYLGSVMAAARVRGFQGDDLSAPDTVLACAKHFVGYGAAEGGRDYNTVDISVQTLRDIYLPPFKAAVDAGVGSVMSAFNEINGVPATGNELTLRKILREEWGFDGVVVSDWKSVTEMNTHGIAGDDADAAEKGIRAGVDMDMSSFSYRTHLGESVRQGHVSVSLIDDAVRRVLRAKQRLGLFERPYADADREKALILCERHRAVARDVAAKSMVLLKNDGGLLPISDSVRSLAVIGPLADDRAAMLGTWAPAGNADDAVTVLKGIANRASHQVDVKYVKGCDVAGDSTDGFAEAVEIAGESDLAILVVGEDAGMSGEAHCRTSLDLPGVQRELVRAVHATGVPTVVVLMCGRPMSIAWTAEHVPAILNIWHPGIEGGHATADVLFGDASPGGKLPATFPRTVGQVPMHYNHKRTGRPPSTKLNSSKYIDVPWTPLFPFGYGLSYAPFEFSNLKLQSERLGTHDRLQVTVDVTNVGTRSADEVVQLYVRDLLASVTRPVKELKAFERITLGPGDLKTVQLEVPCDQLGFCSRTGTYVVEPGEFKVWVGPSSVEGLEADFSLVAD